MDLWDTLEGDDLDRGLLMMDLRDALREALREMTEGCVALARSGNEPLAMGLARVTAVIVAAGGRPYARLERAVADLAAAFGEELLPHVAAEAREAIAVGRRGAAGLSADRRRAIAERIGRSGLPDHPAGWAWCVRGMPGLEWLDTR